MLLIVDEEQTGLGKTGAMFAFEAEEIVPDVVTIAKHFGGGVGVSAVMTTAEIAERATSSEFVLTHSHSNDPMACAAGIASLDVVEEEDVPAKARRLGGYLRERLLGLAERFALIGDVRGRGLLQGLELVRSRETKEPAADEGRAIAERSLEEGLIFSHRRGGSVLRFVPPASTTEAQVDEAMSVLTEALEGVSGEASERRRA